ncbi:MAG: ABC transporter permease [Armatimonadetes bacterium]|nr:ABC transporter permease [Armatimonadota bacterium]
MKPNLFNGFWAVTVKEFKHLLRDKGSVGLAIMLPIFQVVMYGYAIDFDVRHITTVLVDYDHSRESREYVARLHATQYLDFDRKADNEAEAVQMLRANTARVAVVIPPDFSRNVLAGKRAQVGVLVDGSDSQVSFRARTAFLGVQAGSDPPALSLSNVDVRTNVLFNPTSKTSTFMIPGLIGLILQIVLVSLTSGSIVREREQGSLEQLMVSPVGKYGLIFGKLFPFMVLAIGQMTLVLGLGYFLFDVTVAGNLALLYACTFPFVLASLSLGLFISAVAQNQAQAAQLSTFAFLPAILISGFIFPRETMPGFLQLVSLALPLTHELNVLRGIVVRGAGLAELWPSVLAMWVIAGLLLAAASAKFQKSIA